MFGAGGDAGPKVLARVPSARLCLNIDKSILLDETASATSSNFPSVTKPDLPTKDVRRSAGSNYLLLSVVCNADRRALALMPRQYTYNERQCLFALTPK